MRVVIEGNLSQSGSYGMVNFNLAKALASAGHTVSLVGIDMAVQQISDLISNVGVGESVLLAGEPDHQVDVRIRQIWPPIWVRRNPAERLIVIQPWEFGSIPLEWLEGIANIDAIWVPSEYCKRSYLQAGVDPDKVWVVPNGFDDSEIGSIKRKSVASKCKLLFLGGTIFRKGVDILIKSLDQLSDQRLDAIELTVKDAGYDSFYRGQSILEDTLLSHPRIGRRTIVMRDHLSRPGVLSLIAESDLLVHPYRSEGFGLPVLEAMALGTPILHTQNGATNEFCGSAESWLVSSEFTVSELPFVGTSMLADKCYWWEPSIDSLSEQLGRFIDSNGAEYTNLDAAREKASLLTWKNVALLAEEAMNGVLNGDVPSDGLSVLNRELRTALELKPEVSTTNVLFRLVAIGDYGSALQLARSLEAVTDLRIDSEISSVCDRLGSIVTCNPDVWSLGPFRSMVFQSGFEKRDRFAYVHEFEGDTGDTLKIARHISGYFSGCRSILDLGCGQGSMLRVLRSQGKKVQGVDADPSLVRDLSNDGFTIQLGSIPDDLDSLDFDNFDGVFLGHIVEHLTPENVERLFDWIFEKIADDGKILIQTPDISNPQVSMDNFWLDASHLRPYPVKLLKAMLSKSGFIPVDGACRKISEVAPLDIIALARRVPRAKGKLTINTVSSEQAVQVAHVGLFSGDSGFSQASRLMFDVCEYDNGAVEIVRVLVPQQTSAPFQEWKLSTPLKFSQQLSSDIAIVDLPLGWMSEILPQVRAGYRIARTTFEATPLPNSFARSLASFEEIWCFSQFDCQIFIDSGISQSKLHVIPPGIKLPTEEQLELSKRNEAKPFSFLSIFNFEPRKNPSALLRAFAVLVERFPGCELVLKLGGVDIGEFVSWMQGCLTTREMYVIKDQVRVITGSISRESLDQLYLGSDVFVLPTRGEGYGLPFLEALSFGLPVVCPDIGGHRDFCNQENSLLVETHLEPALIAESLGIFQESFWREVVLDELIEKMSQCVADPDLIGRLKRKALSESAKFSVSGYQALASKRLLEIVSNLKTNLAIS